MMSGGTNRRAEHESARLAIAQLALDDDADLSRAVAHALEISGKTLRVSHVGVWLVAPDRDALNLVAVYRPDPATPERPAELPLPTWPTYEAIFRQHRVVAVEDARTDPAAAEIWKSYLEPLGVTALLDSAVFVGGEVWAVVCHEHDGCPRAWSPNEIAFTTAVADMLSTLFEQARRAKAEKQLRGHEQELARARRREMLVQMSAGIAHDFRNALHVIMSSATIARRENDAEKRDAVLAAIVDEAERANRVTRQLTDLARGKDVVLVKIELACCFRAMATTLERIAQVHEVTLRFAVAEVSVRAERTLLERAVTNLVTNAVDASSRGGVVDVSVRRECGSVLIEIADRGAGVPAELQDRLFDPFFTTKEAGGGTGLGLAVVAMAAELFGGHVSTHERDGGGARFVVELPVAE